MKARIPCPTCGDINCTGLHLEATTDDGRVFIDARELARLRKIEAYRAEDKKAFDTLQEDRNRLEDESAKLREERDRAEMACIEVRLSGGKVIESALAVASAVAQRAKP